MTRHDIDPVTLADGMQAIGARWHPEDASWRVPASEAVELGRLLERLTGGDTDGIEVTVKGGEAGGRDALETEIDPETGELVFVNVPRTAGGEVDWSRLGGMPYRTRSGAVIDPRPSVPDPRDGHDGRPVRPE